MRNTFPAAQSAAAVEVILVEDFVELEGVLLLLVLSLVKRSCFLVLCGYFEILLIPCGCLILFPDWVTFQLSS